MSAGQSMDSIFVARGTADAIPIWFVTAASYPDVRKVIGAEVCAFDETGDVGDGEAALEGSFANLHDAEVGFERCEFVIRNFGARGGKTRDERGLADVGIADEADVGEDA